MASGHVNRTNRPNTWLHRPSLRREDSPCQPGAVHTWYLTSKSDVRLNVGSWGISGTVASCPNPAFMTRCEHRCTMLAATVLPLGWKAPADASILMGQGCLIWRRIVASVILSSAARRNAFDRMTDSTLSPSKGSTRSSTGFERWDWPRPGTMQRYWLLGSICILALPRWIR